LGLEKSGVEPHLFEPGTPLGKYFYITAGGTSQRSTTSKVQIYWAWDQV